MINLTCSTLLKICNRLDLSPQIVILFFMDLFLLLIASTLAFTLRGFYDYIDFDVYKTLIPLLLLGPILCIALGSYQTIALPPHRELKCLFIAITLTFSTILAIFFITKTADEYSRIVIVGAWFISLIVIPIARGYTRRYFSKKTWWGRPVIICSNTTISHDIQNTILQNLERGLYPVELIIVDEDTEYDATILQKLSSCAAKYNKPMCILCNPSVQSIFDFNLINELGQYFNGIILIPFCESSKTSIWLAPRDLGNIIGLYIRQNLFDIRRLRFKRFFDIFFVLIGSIFAIPLALLIAICIRIDSKGSIIYEHKRPGQYGNIFKIYKFRTMYTNGDEVLDTYLKNNPEIQEELSQTHKLKNDPRITRVGKFLRQTSLDELPQLFNVLIGEMSLVGPRPMLESEIGDYGSVYKEYCLVKPGITGLWQISGRNDTTYNERVKLVHYYVCNWSVWLDIWILFRTIPVVIKGSGAY